MSSQDKKTPPDSWFKRGANRSEQQKLPIFFVEYIVHHKLNVMDLKCTDIFVRAICTAMGHWDSNWEQMLNDPRYKKCPRFKYVHKYVKE